MGSPTIRREGDKLRPGSACKWKDLLQTSSLQHQLDSRLCSTAKVDPKFGKHLPFARSSGDSHMFSSTCCSSYCLPTSCHIPPHSRGHTPGAAINSDLVLLCKAMGAGAGASTGGAVLCPSFSLPFRMWQAGRPWSLSATHYSIITVTDVYGIMY